MIACPKCAREWEAPCQQTWCIKRYGECIACRFIDQGEHNPHGSGEGTAQELNAIPCPNELSGNSGQLPTPPTDAQVEAAAIRMWNLDPGPEWAHMPDSAKASYRRLARAALVAGR